MVRRLIFTCLAALMLPVAAFAQSTEYRKFLLPLTPATVLGADGARWDVTLTLSNASFDPLSLFCFTGQCQPIEARTVHRVAAPPASTILPGLMYVPVDQSRRTFAALRSRNTTPNSEEINFVSEIPVVHENDFRSEVVEIAAVPIEANYRHMLRVYDANANENAEVRVRIFGMLNGQIVTGALVDTVLTLRTNRGSASPYARPDEPSWAALADFGDMPEVRNYQEVHIRIESESDNMAMWAFATATNNTTQRFAVYTP
jgi:hypothetical protein